MPANANPVAIPELNKNVLTYTAGRIGETVGDGECTSLVAEALKAAGAQPPRGFTFGRQLGAGEQPLPGDVMQFTSSRFEQGNTKTNLGLPNHTAIVYAVNGNKLSLLHQNFNGVRAVQTLTLDLETKVGGSLDVFRPIPPGAK